MALNKIKTNRSYALEDFAYYDADGEVVLGIGIQEGVDITANSETEGDVAHDAADSGNPVKIGGKAFTSKPSAVANNDRVDGYFDEYGRLHVVNENGISLPPANYFSPNDFSVVYTSNVTITCSSVPFTVADDTCFISYIYYLPSGGSWTSLVNGINGVSITASANVITVAGAGTPFASGDTYIVGILYQNKAYDDTTDTIKNTVLNPTYARYASPQNLINSAQEITDTFTDLGGEIPTSGYKILKVFFTLDINTSTDVRIKVFGKHTNGGAGEFVYDPNSWSLRDSSLAADGSYREIDTDADGTFILEIALDNAMPYIQIQVRDSADGTGQIDDAVYVLGY